MRINNTSKIPNTIMRELTHHDRRVRKKLSGKLLSLFRKQLSHSGKKCDLLELRRLVSEFIQQRLHFQSARSLLRQLRHQLGCAALATALLATIGVAPAYAAGFPTIQTGGNNPFNGVNVGSYSTPTFVDIDNDGDFDAFIGDDSGNIHYYKNTGSNSSPTFTAQTGGNNPFNGVNVGSYIAPTFVDIDNDGDFDVFIGEEDGDIYYYKNTGSNSSPTFTAQTGGNNPLNGVDVGSYSKPSFVDIDNDGDFDAFIGEQNGSINYYKNTGSNSSPTFTAQTGGNNPLNGVDVGSYSTPTFVDFDNDGDFDVFIGEDAGSILHYENTGSNSSPTFTAQTGGNNPLKFVDGSYSAPTFVDIDNDGDFDVFIGDEDGDIYYYKNTVGNSNTTFSHQAGANNPLNGVDVGSYSKPTFVDIDNDGDFDVFIGEDAGNINYYKNTGSNSSPTFTAQTGGNNPLNGVDVGSYSIPTFVDIDNDGDFDVFIGEDLGNINYYKNTGSNSSPTFTAQTGGNNPLNGVDVGSASKPSFVDIDNDGDIDVFFGEYAGNINYYKNTGSNSSPTFTEQTGGNNPFNGVDVGAYSTPTFVDIDNDGDFDAFIGELVGSINYYKNTGSNSSPTFTEQTGANNLFPGVDVGSYSIPTFVDIDNDGDFDAFIGEGYGSILYYKNTSADTNTAPTAATLVSPENGSTVTSPVTLSWNASTDADNNTLSYTVSVCSDSSFSGCTADNVSLAFAPESFPGDPGSSELILPWSNSAYAISSAASSSSGNSTGMQPESWVLAFFLLIGVSGFSAMLSRGRRKLALACAMLTFWLVSCAAKDDDKSTTTDKESATTSAVGSITHTVNNLVSGTTYYWKVTTSDGITTTDSAVRTFTVE